MRVTTAIWNYNEEDETQTNRPFTVCTLAGCGEHRERESKIFRTSHDLGVSPYAQLVHSLSPEIVRGTNRLLQLDARSRQKRGFVTTLQGTIQDAVVDNPNYAFYVAPVALAYMVSHPHFNIYKGSLADIRLFGFGLDDDSTFHDCVCLFPFGYGYPRCLCTQHSA